MDHALGNAAHDLGLGGLQSCLSGLFVALGQRFFDLAGEVPDPALAGNIDRGPLGGPTNELFGRVDIGNGRPNSTAGAGSI